MLMESWAIILLIFVMAGVFFHRRKINYAVMTLPLGIVPAARVISGPIAAAFRGLGLPVTAPFLRCGVIAIGLAASCILIWGLSKNASSLKARRCYMLVCILFSVCLAWVLMADVLMI